MEIRRDVYLERLERLRFKGGVKIITGVRRGGKSYLLFNIFRDHHLETGIRSDHVIAIALDSIENRHLRGAEALYKEIASRIIDSKEYYVMIDEIQLAEDFVDLVNGLAGRRNVDLYITGSNSRFLSSDIVTESRGRGTEIDENTVSEYISFLEDSFLFERSKRFDLKGNGYIDTPSKYYSVDLGLRNAGLGFRQNEYSHLMENAIYNELRGRGYRVDVGVIGIREYISGRREYKQLEIDFVANKGSERIYIQSAYRMDDPDKAEQEARPFLKVNDGFRKLIPVGDDVPVHVNGKGVIIMNAIDFMKDPREPGIAASATVSTAPVRTADGAFGDGGLLIPERGFDDPLEIGCIDASRDPVSSVEHEERHRLHSVAAGPRLVVQHILGVLVAVQDLPDPVRIHPGVRGDALKDSVIRKNQIVGEERPVEPVDHVVPHAPADAVRRLHQPVGVHRVRVPGRSVMEVESFGCRHGLDAVDLHPRAFDAHALLVAQEYPVLRHLPGHRIQPERSEIQSRDVVRTRFAQDPLQSGLRDVAERA